MRAKRYTFQYLIAHLSESIGLESLYAPNILHIFSEQVINSFKTLNSCQSFSPAIFLHYTRLLSAGVGYN